MRRRGSSGSDDLQAVTPIDCGVREEAASAPHPAPLVQRCRVWPFLLLALALLARLAAPARAVEVAPGLEYDVLPGKFSGGPVHALRVDLQRFRVVQTDPTQPLTLTASAFAKVTGAIAVTNANFFVSASSGPPVGLMAGQGQVATNSVLWYQPPTFTFSLGFRFADGFARPFSSAGLLHGPLPDCLTEAFTGNEAPLKDGVVSTTSPTTDKGVFARHPRTVLGLSQDRRFAFLFVAQGRGIPAGALGYRVVGSASIGHVAREHGAWDAINLDGGGSSVLWIPSLGGIKNSPTDGHERQVPFHLGIVPAPTTLGPVACSTHDAGVPRDAEPPLLPLDAGHEEVAPQLRPDHDGSPNRGDGQRPAMVQLQGSGCSLACTPPTQWSSLALLLLTSLFLLRRLFRRPALATTRPGISRVRR